MRNSLVRLSATAFVLAVAHLAFAELPEQIASVAPRAKRAQDVRAFKVSEKTGRMPVRLPDGELLRFVPLSVRERHGVTTTRASVDGARLLLTSDGHDAFGYIAAGDANYRITTVGRDTYVIDSAALPPAADVPLSPLLDDVHVDPVLMERVRQRLPGRLESGKAAIESQAAPYSIIDVAIFLDPALLGIQSAQSLRTAAQAYIDYTNEAFIRNHIEAELNLVLVEEYGGTIKPSDPFPGFYSDPVPLARASAFGADLYHLLYFQRSSVPYCGMAGMIDSAGVSGFQCGARTLAHELGHNFGANHDRNNASNELPGPLNAYNYGFVCGGDATIMSYVGAEQLSHYSDPDLFNKGEACGVAFDQPNGAHNGHVIEVMRTEMEAMRAPQPIYGNVTLQSGAIAMSESDAPLDVLVTRDGDLTQAVSVEVGAIDDTAEEGRDYLPLLGRLEFAAGETSKQVRIAPVDDEDYEEEEGFRLVLRYPLGLAVVGEPVTVTLQDDDPDLGKAVLATDAITVSESEGPVAVTVNRVGSSAASLTIQYATGDGTGVAGECYQAVSGSLTFAPGETTKIVQVPIIDNVQFDPAGFRTFSFSISGSNLGEFAGAITTTSVKIVDNDPNRGKAQFLSDRNAVNEASGRARIFVRRTDSTEQDLVVSFATADGSAHAGTDYTATQGTLTFAPGEDSKSLEIPVRDNTAVDGSREFTVSLIGDFVGTPATTTVTIGDNDPSSTPSPGKKGGGGGLEAGSLLLLALLAVRKRRGSDRAR